MSSYDKVIKLACKPKAVPPKAKYIDNIIAATYSEDGAVHDVCKALAPKFREPNAIVVFKALIVLHTMLRNGQTDNVLSYLSQSDVLRLRNVSNGQWEGYTPPENLSSYALYLDIRVRSYKDLKHDPIRVQSESNRDLRVSMEDSRPRSSNGAGGSSSNPGLQRGKTIMGRKLRVMTVEKGLLRETKIVQKIVDMLLDCQFYLDDLEDELIITALRMLVKDILVLFQAVNEGVINVLEHYFEMSKVDATTALALYRHFCRQTERVVEYLTIARKLQNLLNVPIPSLKHAPVSLAGALDEYLRDPNFEQNRIEYKTNKELADANGKNPKAKKPSAQNGPSSKPETKATPALKPVAETPKEVKKPDTNKELVDFFTSIEAEQTPMFDGQTTSPTGGAYQPQGAPNPFMMQNQTPMMTGFVGNPFFNASPFASTGFVGAQPTGAPFIQPQTTAFPSIQLQPTGFPTNQNGLLSPGGPGPFPRPQSAAPFLQPQATGFNPFRQSVVSPQMTGMPFGGNYSTGNQPTLSPFASGSLSGTAGVTGSVTSPATDTQRVVPPGTSSSAILPSPASKSPFPFAMDSGAGNVNPQSTAPFITRPASTPVTSFGQAAKPLVSQPTGSNNPFGRPKSPPPPPVPPMPTMGQLAAHQYGSFNGLSASGGQSGSSNEMGEFGKPGGQSATSPFSNVNSTMGGTSIVGNPTNGFGTTSSTMSSIASSFFDANKKPSSPPPSGSIGASLFGSSAFSPISPQQTATSASATSMFSSHPTGSSTTTPSVSFLQPQATGFKGSSIKPFKPSSSFGASLLDSLPTIPQGATSNVNNTPSTQPPGPTSPTGALNTQPTGFPSLGSTGFNSGLIAGAGGGLLPQMTGANPFRASVFAPGGAGGNLNSPSNFMGANNAGANTNAPNNGNGASLFATPTGMNKPFTPSSSFGASLFNSGSSMPGTFPNSPNPLQQQSQQQNSASLI